VDGFHVEPGAQPVDVREDLTAQRPLARPSGLGPRLEQVGELLRANLADETAALEKLAGQADRLATIAVERPTTK